MNCGHTVTRISSRYIDWDGEEHIDYAEYPDCEDIDLHRYRCNQCGKIYYYYSGAAKNYYEDGIKHPYISGLN